MPPQHGTRPERRYVPEDDRGVVAPRRQELPVRAEGQAAHDVDMPDRLGLTVRRRHQPGHDLTGGRADETRDAEDRDVSATGLNAVPRDGQERLALGIRSRRDGHRIDDPRWPAQIIGRIDCAIRGSSSRKSQTFTTLSSPPESSVASSCQSRLRTRAWWPPVSTMRMGILKLRTSSWAWTGPIPKTKIQSPSPIHRSWLFRGMNLAHFLRSSRPTLP